MKISTNNLYRGVISIFKRIPASRRFFSFPQKIWKFPGEPKTGSSNHKRSSERSRPPEIWTTRRYRYLLFLCSNIYVLPNIRIIPHSQSYFSDYFHKSIALYFNKTVWCVCIVYSGNSSNILLSKGKKNFSLYFCFDVSVVVGDDMKIFHNSRGTHILCSFTDPS